MAEAETHVVVLAAGYGRRLGQHGSLIPKWLLDVGGRTIADRHLEAIEAANGVASVRVVTGHQAEVVDEFLAAHAFPDATSVFNAEYAALNNWYSLLLAMRSIEGAEGRVVVVNSDLCARSSWIQAFIDDAATTSSEALIAIDLERNLTDESMKVSTADDALATIGKVGIEDPVGEYVGMLMARGETLRNLREVLEGFVGQPESVDEWYERAVGITASTGDRWVIWPTPDSRWVEIDDEVDYAAAPEIVGD